VDDEEQHLKHDQTVGHLVITDALVGLTQETADKLIALLSV